MEKKIAFEGIVSQISRCQKDNKDEALSYPCILDSLQPDYEWAPASYAPVISVICAESFAKISLYNMPNCSRIFIASCWCSFEGQTDR